MKSTTIASEKTHAFYIKLKRSPMADWFVPELEHQVKVNKVKLPKHSLKNEFKVTRFGYFNKHAWYFFSNDSVSGWLPLKSVRENYRRLAVTAVEQKSDTIQDSYLAAVLMLFQYSGSDFSVDELDSLFSNSQMDYPMPSDLFTIIVERTGSFKNLSNKKLRRLRNHLRRERPIILWVSGSKNADNSAILLTGFNKKLFFYIDPRTGGVHTMTKKALVKRWKAAGYLAISY